jgi:hypothetical protein
VKGEENVVYIHNEILSNPAKGAKPVNFNMNEPGVIMLMK